MNLNIAKNEKYNTPPQGLTIEYALSANGRPLWQVWEMSGKEMAWIYTHGDNHKTYREISKEEYTSLVVQHPGAPGILVHYDEDEEKEGEGEAPLYHEVISTIPLPKVGTRIHFQTGHTSWSPTPYKAQVYRATWDGVRWTWEVSKECYARQLQERVYSLCDIDYQAVASAPYFSNEDWLVDTSTQPQGNGAKEKEE